MQPATRLLQLSCPNPQNLKLWPRPRPGVSSCTRWHTSCSSEAGPLWSWPGLGLGMVTTTSPVPRGSEQDLPETPGIFTTSSARPMRGQHSPQW